MKVVHNFRWFCNFHFFYTHCIFVCIKIDDFHIGEKQKNPAYVPIFKIIHCFKCAQYVRHMHHMWYTSTAYGAGN